MRDRDQTLLLIDCFALVHRAYHAFPPNLRISDGTLVNAVYGFTSLLLDVLIKFRPSHVVAVFDSAGPTVRHQEYGAYKATRREPDEDFLAQLPLVEKVLLTLDIPLLAVKGFEADDVIGTIDKRHSGAWARTIIVTGDRDLFQLVDDDTFVYLAGSSFSKSQLYDREAVRAKMGIYPEFITDLKGLQGDASDNIPGVYGIGEKGAVSLLQRFGNIENL
jgi:DNA polymerase-1